MIKKLSKCFFSSIFIGIIILLILYPKLNDRITVTIWILLGIAFLPWIKNYIKSIKIGENEVIFNEQKINETITKIKKTENNNKSKDSFEIGMLKELIPLPELATTFLDNFRLIEKGLKLICEKNDIYYIFNIKKMCEMLAVKNIITVEVNSLVRDITPIRNRIIHNGTAEIEYRDLYIANKMSLTVIDYFNKYFAENRKKK